MDDMVRLGLDYETLRKLNSSFVITSIATFGQTGPYRDYKGRVVVNFYVMEGSPLATGDIIQLNGNIHLPRKGASNR